MVPPTPLRFAVAHGTNPGLKRSLNEDSVLAQYPVFLVADGMGGHQGGEVASRLALQAFEPLLGRADVTLPEVRDAVATAQQQVTAFADSLAGGAGTTLTGVVATRTEGESEWVVVNIGDSRTYRRCGKHFVRLSHDHSLVQELVDDAGLTEREALTHPNRNVVTRALGDGESEADFWVTSTRAGERVVVVSDGALEGTTDSELAGNCEAADASAAAEQVIEAALLKGGSDNITVIVIDVLGSEADDEADTPLPPVRKVDAAIDSPGPDDDTNPAARRRDDSGV